MAIASRRLATPSSVNAAIKQIADVMRRANYAGALQYVPELSWILFLRILDEREALEAEEATAVGVEFAPSLQAPFRWRDWAAPDGAKRRELTDAPMGSFLGFVNGDLLPYLRGLRDRPSAGRARRSSARSSRRSTRSASTRSGTCSTSSIGSTRSARRRSTRPTSSRSARPMRACC